MWYNLKEIFRINMKNKVITGLLGFLVVLGMATPALADEVKNPNAIVTEGSAKEGKTTVESTVASNFTLQVPASFTLTYNTFDTQIGGVKILNGADSNGNGYGIAANQVVNVTAKNDGPLTSQNGGTIKFTVNDQASASKDSFDSDNFGTKQFTNSDVISGKEVPVFMHIGQDQWNNAASGNYTGSITFSATLTNK